MSVRVIVEHEDGTKKCFECGNFINAMRKQAELIKKYKNDKSVKAISYEAD